MVYKNISYKNIYHPKMVCYRKGFRHSLRVEGILFDMWRCLTTLSGCRGFAAAVNPVILERQMSDAIDAPLCQVTGGKQPDVNFAAVAVGRLRPLNSRCQPGSRRSIIHSSGASQADTKLP
jgi:hypothetical protein